MILYVNTLGDYHPPLGYSTNNLGHIALAGASPESESTMAKYGTGTFTGDSGTSYEFTAYTVDTVFNAVGAVYIITERTAKQDGGGSHYVIYVGQTGDLSERFEDHHKAACFKKHRANCILIHPESNEKARLKIETDLCRKYSTAPCNG